MKIINIGIIGPQKQMDPVLGYNLFDFLVIQCVYQTLVRINSSGNITSDLADRWEISKDGKIYTFQLDPKAKYSDGSQVTADDVAFSLSRHLWTNSKSIIKNYLSDLIENVPVLKPNEIASSFKVINPTKLEIHLKNPYPPFLQVLSMPGFSIVPSNPNLRLRNVGSGHMKAEFEDKSSSWILTPNPFYSGTKISTNEIRISSLKDATEAFKAINEFKTDVVLGLMSETGPGLTSMIPENYIVYSTNSLSFAHLIYNMKKPEFQNLELRKSLGLIINALAKSVSIPSSNFHYQKTFIPKGVLPLTYFDRKLEDGNAEKIISELHKKIKDIHLKVILSDGRLPKDFVNKLKEIFFKISKNIVIEELNVGEYRKRRDSGDYDIAYLGYIGNYADPDGFIDCIRENNFPGVDVNSNDFFKVISSFKFNPITTERIDSYVKALRSFEDQWTIIPLYQTNIPIIHHKNILIPDTHFRYESELWSFLWKAE